MAGKVLLMVQEAVALQLQDYGEKNPAFFHALRIFSSVAASFRA
jgi:hypothetical protein